MEIVRKTHIIASILIGFVIILTVAGLPTEVYNYPKTSTLFGVSIICLVTIILFPLFMLCKSMRVKWKDGLLLCFLIYYLIDFNQIDTLSNMGYICLLLLGIVIYFLNKISYTIIYAACCLALSLLVIYGYLQYFELLSSYNRYFSLTGPYYNPAIFGMMLALFSIVVANRLILYRNRFKKHRYTFILTITLLTVSIPLLILTHARAAYLALIISILYTLYFRFLHHKGSRTQMLWIGSGIAIVFFSIGMFYMLKPRSADGRRLIWCISYEMIKDKPVTGFGSGSFAGNYMYYQAEYMKSTTSTYEKEIAGSTHLAFNEFLLMTVEHGIVGLFAYIAFVVWVFYPPKKNNGVTITTKSIIAGTVTWGMFAYPSHTFPVIAILILATACYLNKSNPRNRGIVLGKWYKRIAIWATVCISLLVGINILIKFKTYHELHFFIRNQSFTELSGKTDILSKFMPTMNDDVSFLYMYGKIAQMADLKNIFFDTVQKLEKTLPTSELFVMKGEVLQQTGNYTEAEEAYLMAAAMEPSKQTARGRLAIMYKVMGRHKEAKTLAHDILTEKVKVYGFDTFELHRTLKRIFEDELK